MAFIGFSTKNMPAPTARTSQGLLPAGTKIRGYIQASEEKTALSGSTYILYTFLGGNQQSYRHMVMLSGSEKAVAFGLAKHAELAHACGVETFTDSSELHDIEMELVLGIEPARDSFPERNIIKHVNCVAGVKQNMQTRSYANSIIDDESPF